MSSVRIVDTAPAVLEAYGPLLRRLEAGRFVEAEASQLADEAADLLMRPGFDTLVSLPRLRFEPFEHQLQAASAALRRMRGRAILADEVGLGKTIEAALVASELHLRGLARRVLILVPAGLVDQWPLPKPHVSAILGAGGEDVSPHLAWEGSPPGHAASPSPATTPTPPPAPGSGTGPSTTSPPTSPSSPTAPAAPTAPGYRKARKP